MLVKGGREAGCASCLISIQYPLPDYKKFYECGITLLEKKLPQACNCCAEGIVHFSVWIQAEVDLKNTHEQRI